MLKRAFGWVSHRRLVILFWMGATIAVAVMAYTRAVAWDAQVYWETVQTLRHGADPYAAGIAAQQAFYHRPASDPATHVPFTYIYSPMTLPLLRLLMALPDRLLGVLYGSAVAAGFLVQLWAGFQMAEERERRWLALMLPAVAFFPGLISDDVALSGNVAYILYGLVLAAAVRGWKRGQWFWYYFAVLAASVVKVPLLALLAFPILAGKRQWFAAGGTAAAGVLLFAAQARLWPQQFREYMISLRLAFDGGNEFGFGPAGVLGKTLWHMGRPYFVASAILFLMSTCMVGIVLLVLTRRVQRGNITQETWIPVALVATLLFYPRIMRYDLAGLTVPMLLIGWRTLRNAVENSARGSLGGPLSRFTSTAATGAVCFLGANVIAAASPGFVPVELMVLLVIFTSGAWSIYRPRTLCRQSNPLTEGREFVGRPSQTLRAACYDDAQPVGEF